MSPFFHETCHVTFFIETEAHAHGYDMQNISRVHSELILEIHIFTPARHRLWAVMSQTRSHDAPMQIKPRLFPARIGRGCSQCPDHVSYG